MPDASIPRDEPTIVRGDRLADDSSHKVVAAVQDKIVHIYPSATPLLKLKSGVKSKRSVENYKFEHLEKDIYPRRITLAADCAAGAATATVATNDYLKMAKNFTYLNTRTREQFVLTATPTSDSISGIHRALGGLSTNMDAGDTCELQAPIHQEADTLGVIRSIKETRLWNYLEIIRTPMGWCGRTAKMKYYGGKDPAGVRASTAIEHKISIERRGFFGRRDSRTTSDNKQQTFTGGGEYWIESHVWDLDENTLSERGLVEWMEDVMETGQGGYVNGRGVKWLFAGNSLLTEIEFFARDKLRYEPLTAKIGMRAASFHSTHGVLNIIRHPQFTGDHSGWGFVVDMNHVKYVHMEGRDTMILRDRHARSFDGTEEEYFTDCGWQWENQSAHGIIKNHRIRA